MAFGQYDDHVWEWRSYTVLHPPAPPPTGLVAILTMIARGREDCGRPLSGERARQLARDVLYANHIDWGRPRVAGEIPCILCHDSIECRINVRCKFNGK